MTGGLQEQVTNGKDWFGIGIKPASKAVIGSQQVPYIHEDRVSEEDFVNALEQMILMPEEKRNKMILGGLKHVKQNYNFSNFQNSWVKIMDDLIENCGSWESRKNYKSWELKQI
jgi:glycosyltransferase involved in cell wall biosynthesis